MRQPHSHLYRRPLDSDIDDTVIQPLSDHRFRPINRYRPGMQCRLLALHLLNVTGRNAS